MSVPAPLAVTAAQMAIVLSVIGSWSPAETKLWVFWSRANGGHKRYSDLDLLVDAGRRMTFAESDDLREMVSESHLPWKVDVVDRHGTANYFLCIIEPQCVALPAFATLL
jgi:predicted nucleotidyltransferase